MKAEDLRVIDAHQHLIYPTGSDPLKAIRFDAERFLADPEIEGAWLLSLSDGVIHPERDYDEATLRSAVQFPGRIIPFGFLDFRKPVDHIDALKARGFAGLKAHFPLQPYDSDAYLPFYERAERLNLPIVFHTGGGHAGDSVERGFAAWTYPEGMLLKNSSVSTLDRIAKYFQKLVLVAAHMGGPAGFNDCIHLARSNANLYFDLSCSPLDRQWQLQLREVVESVSASKIIYGSDTRQPGAGITAKFWKYFLLTRSWLTPSGAEMILAGNARRIVAESDFDPAKIQLQANATS